MANRYIEKGRSPTANIMSVSATTDASPAENAPRWSSATMIGRARPRYSAAAGTTTTAARRRPRDNWERSAARSPRAAALAISGVNVVMSETANNPCGSWKKAYALM